MSTKAPQHFSHNFKLAIDVLPTKESDRINLHILLPGLFFGAVLVFLGIFELMNGFKHGVNHFDGTFPEIKTAIENTFINPVFFDIVIAVLGVGIITSLILSYIRYKKIFFDGNTVTVIHRPALGKKKTIREPLKNYEGVMLRIEFFQCGFMNKNKYIVELHHKNSQKTIPLYITTSDKNIRKIWETYAAKLNMPTLIETDEGILKRETKDLGKSLREMSKIYDLKEKITPQTKHSSCIDYTQKPDKTIIKSRKVIWDAFNIMAWIVIFMLVALCFIVSINASTLSTTFLIVFYTVCLAGIVTSIWILFRKDKLVIKKDKIVNTHKYMLFSTKHDEMMLDDVESVDISVNPVTGRYFVAIASAEKTIIFGKKLPTNDLKWVKKFLVNEIIKAR